MIVAIVQARYGSTRLPGKVLAELGGRTVLSHVLHRASMIPGVEQTCCAIPSSPDSDAVAAEAERSGAAVFRGSEEDVLSRYVGAARLCRAETVIRITSDCPFLDPRVSGEILSAYLERGVEYCSNLHPRSWPKGLDTEVFSREVLERAGAEAAATPEREHVTTWIRTHPQLPRHNVALTGDDCSTWRWTLDYPEDLSFFRTVCERLDGCSGTPLFEDVRAVVTQHPEIAALNRHLL